MMDKEAQEKSQQFEGEILKAHCFDWALSAPAISWLYWMQTSEECRKILHKIGYRKLPDRPELREKIAEWLFNYTDMAGGSLRDSELDGWITKYEHLITLPKGRDFEEYEVEELKELRDELLESADQILALIGLPKDKPP